MANKIKGWSKTILFILALFFILLFLLVCLVPFINSGSLWFISILGLGFPVLLLAVVICLVVWLIRRSRWAILPAVALLLGWKQIGVAFGLHFFRSDFRQEKQTDVIRVLNWNVYRWDEQNKKARGGESNRLLMMDEVVKRDADILCFQEFFQPYHSKRYEGNLEELQERGVIRTVIFSRLQTF